MADMDAIDVGLTPEAHHNDEGVAVEIDLLRHLNHYTVYNKVRAVDIPFWLVLVVLERFTSLKVNR